MSISKPSICLNMIVKNEAHVIKETIDNIIQYMPITYWVICDTGSTDGTQDAIKSKFDILGIPGEMYQHEWKDFAHNRTLALKCAYNKTDFVFIFDADDKFHKHFVLPELTCDMYHFKFSSEDGYFSYQRPLLVNNKMDWKFVGVLHEYLTNADGVSHSCEEIAGDYYVESGKTGDRSKNPNKYKDDARVLMRAYEKESDERLKDRYAFYCAQSFMDDTNFENSIYWYKKVLEGNNWNQEKFYSCLMLGNIYLQLNNVSNAMKYWVKTSEYDEERPEGIVKFMELFYQTDTHSVVTSIYNNFKNKFRYITKDKLFLDTSSFHKAEYFNSVSAYYAKDFQSGYDCVKHLVKNGHYVELCMNNLQFYKECMESDCEAYDVFFIKLDEILQQKNDPPKYMVELWNSLWSKKPSLPICEISIPQNTKKCNVMITFTSCKRYDLFERTIKSILCTWNDLQMIDYWYCIDDNSSYEDRQKMRSMFPWIDFYMKSPNEKGHRESMNMIWNELKNKNPTYWIHMEDDFEFFRKQNYITNTLEYFEQLQPYNVKQILFNRCYAETIDDISIPGHSISNECTSCCVHHYDTNISTGCNYWPHYSFRPSIILAQTILDLGNFDSQNQFFEFDYAQKFSNSGFKSAYFNQITNIHIGRLTKDRFGESENAYTLNNENQF